MKKRAISSTAAALAIVIIIAVAGAAAFVFLRNMASSTSLSSTYETSTSSVNYTMDTFPNYLPKMLPNNCSNTYPPYTYHSSLILPNSTSIVRYTENWYNVSVFLLNPGSIAKLCVIDYSYLGSYYSGMVEPSILNSPNQTLYNGTDLKFTAEPNPISVPVNGDQEVVYTLTSTTNAKGFYQLSVTPLPCWIVGVAIGIQSSEVTANDFNESAPSGVGSVLTFCAGQPGPIYSWIEGYSGMTIKWIIYEVTSTTYLGTTTTTGTS